MTPCFDRFWLCVATQCTFWLILMHFWTDLIYRKHIWRDLTLKIKQNDRKWAFRHQVKKVFSCTFLVLFGGVFTPKRPLKNSKKHKSVFAATLRTLGTLCVWEMERKSRGWNILPPEIHNLTFNSIGWLIQKYLSYPPEMLAIGDIFLPNGG